MNPVISVIVPIYNVEKYLNRCVDSIINQTYKNLEIILVNDESPDNCGVICDEYEKKDNRIRVIHQQNKGLSGARNSGLSIATGDYIGFVDSDDWIHDEMYEILVKHITTSKSDVAICNFVESDSLGNSTLDSNPEVRLLDKKGVMWNYLNYGFYVWRILYSRELIKEIQFEEDKKFIEDVFFGANIIDKIKRGIFIDLPLCIYNVDNVSSLTRSGYNKNIFLSLDANICVQKTINQIFPEDKELNHFIQNRLVGNCLFHLQSLHLKENEDLDTNGVFRKKVKNTFNKNHTFFRSNNALKTVVRVLNLSMLKYFYKIYFLKNRQLNAPS